MTWFKEDYIIIMPTHQIFEAIKEAKKEIEGSEIAQHAKLKDYCEELIRYNLRSSIQIGLEKMPLKLFPKFDRLYICLESCKREFIRGYKPLIGLEACHLKGYYGGQPITTMA